MFDIHLSCGFIIRGASNKDVEIIEAAITANDRKLLYFDTGDGRTATFNPRHVTVILSKGNK